MANNRPGPSSNFSSAVDRMTFFRPPVDKSLSELYREKVAAGKSADLAYPEEMKLFFVKSERKSQENIRV